MIDGNFELIEELRVERRERAALIAKVEELLGRVEGLKVFIPTPIVKEKEEEPAKKSRAKSKTAPDWDKLDEWLSKREAALVAARMSEGEFKSWAKTHKIRTRAYGLRKRYHRDDIRGFRP